MTKHSVFQVQGEIQIAQVRTVLKTGRTLSHVLYVYVELRFWWLVYSKSVDCLPPSSEPATEFVRPLVKIDKDFRDAGPSEPRAPCGCRRRVSEKPSPAYVNIGFTSPAPLVTLQLLPFAKHISHIPCFPSLRNQLLCVKHAELNLWIRKLF